MHIPKTPRQVQHAPKKRFGQNFLHDTQVISQIVHAIKLHADDCLIEIGPGLGALTEPLLHEVNAMTVIELDTALAQSLRLNIGANSHTDFHIVQANALHVDFFALHQDPKHNKNHQKLRIVGNLPYNISTPLLFHLLQFGAVIADMHFMLQKEVVERITAAVGSKEYGRLSVMIQYHCQPTYLLTVPAGAFHPPPKVTSSVFRLMPYLDKPILAHDEAFFAQIVRECFNHRRKTLRAIFKNSATLPKIDDALFVQAGIDPMARPEVLSVADFVALSNHLLPITS